MKRLYTKRSIKSLKDGTIIIQKYHKYSKDGSKFDINMKKGEYVFLIEQIGGKKVLHKGTKTLIKEIIIGDNQLLYIAEAWLQKLYSGVNEK